MSCSNCMYVYKNIAPPSKLIVKPVLYSHQYTFTQLDLDATTTKQVLRELNPVLMKYMDPRALLPYLIKHRLLTDEDRDFITNPYRTDSERKHRILQRISNTGPGSIHILLQVLSEESEHSGHGHLVKMIRKTIKTKCQERASSKYNV